MVSGKLPGGPRVPGPSLHLCQLGEQKVCLSRLYARRGLNDRPKAGRVLGELGPGTSSTLDWLALIPGDNERQRVKVKSPPDSYRSDIPYSFCSRLT